MITVPADVIGTHHLMPICIDIQISVYTSRSDRQADRQIDRQTHTDHTATIYNPTAHAPRVKDFSVKNKFCISSITMAATIEVWCLSEGSFFVPCTTLSCGAVAASFVCACMSERVRDIT